MATPESEIYSQTARTTSRFTYRHLQVLSSSSPAKESPLRVVALCDLDCFYAQVEGVRIKADPDLPLAVSQWGGLIAIVRLVYPCGIAADDLELCCEVASFPGNHSLDH